MKLRYSMLLISVGIFAGSLAMCEWFWAQPMGRQFAFGMLPYIFMGAGLTIYWMHRILSGRQLLPGECECGHMRCVHKEGKGACRIAYGVSDKFPKGSSCACDKFIPKMPAPKPVSSKQDEEVLRLKKMAGL